MNADIDPFAREGERDRPSDPDGAAGNDCRFTPELHGIAPA
jgi:hypothetical protein